MLYIEKMENVRNRINVKLASYMSHKIFDNDLVAIRKGKVILTLNKPAYIGMCFLELSKVLMYECRYDYVENIYGNNRNY